METGGSPVASSVDILSAWCLGEGALVLIEDGENKA